MYWLVPNGRVNVLLVHENHLITFTPEVVKSRVCSWNMPNPLLTVTLLLLVLYDSSPP